MTIIEAALEKTKALRGGRPESRSAPDPRGSETSEHTRVAMQPPSQRTAPPGTQIQPQRVEFDPYMARENRLLLGGATAEDRIAISAYGMLRTRILHRARSAGWQSIGVTSAAPQDGKSLTSVNLALSLAREKNNCVFLLDLDMRNPSVCHTLGITPPLELREFFENRIDTPENVFMSIGVDNLLIAGNVIPTEHSAELLASTRLEELLAFIKQMTSQPLILIDLPPVVSPADTLVVAPRIDAFVLVASQGVTPRAELQKAGELLSEYPIAGFVLNRQVGGSKSYDYGYGGGSERG
jgi:protein-tyrosine kinase